MAKIHIEKAELERVLKIVGTCVVPNRALPISEYVRITTKGDRMKVEASNTYSALRTYVGMDMPSNDMSFCVNYKNLSRYVASIADDSVTMDIDIEGSCVKVFHSGGDFTLPCLNAKDFPETEAPTADGSQEFSIPGEAISEWLQQTKNFTVSDALRPVLAGAYIEGNEGTISISASDTKVLYHDSFNLESIKEPLGAIIPQTAFESIISIADGAESLAVITNGKKVWFKSGTTMLTVALLVGKYPNVKSVIPAKHIFEATISRKRLLESLKRIGLAIGSKSHMVKFVFSSSGVLTLLHENFVDNKTSSEFMNYDGGIDFTIAFGHDSFIKGLTAMTSDDVTIFFNDPRHAAVLKETEENERKTILIMPMAVSSVK